MLSIARALFLAAALMVPLWAVRLGGFAVADLLFGAACIVASAVVLARGQGAPARPVGYLAGSCLLIAGALSAGRAVAVGEHLVAVAQAVFTVAALPWVARVVLRREDVERVLLYFVAGGALSALAAAAQLRWGVEIPNSIAVGGRAAGMNVHPNQQGVTLAIASIVVLALVVHGRGSRRVLLGGVVCLVGLVLSGSVSAMIAAAVGVFVVLARRGVRTKTLAGIALVIAVSLLAPGLFGAQSPMERVLSSTGRTGINTVDTRTESAEAALAEVWRSPFIGDGLDEGSTFQYNNEVATHNFVLLAWVQGGILTVVAFVLVAGYALAVLWRRRSALGEAIMGSLAVGLVYGMSAPMLFERYLFVVIALALVATTHGVESRASKERSAVPATPAP